MLCTPFHRDDRPFGEANRLDQEIEWVTRAASQAGFDLRPVKDEYDSSEQIADRICRTIRETDLVVAILAEGNPNVFFEAGYALGLGRPIFYVARRKEDIPFDIAGIECFIAGDYINDEVIARAAAGMAQCVATGRGMNEAAARLQSRVLQLNADESLLGRCMRHALGSVADWVSSWGDSGFEISGAAGILEMGCHIMSEAPRVGFATYYYTGQSSWRGDSGSEPDYFEATRRAVVEGAEITRVFVVDELDQIDEKEFRELVWADSAAGIDVRYILTSKLPDPKARDFGFWDEELFCEVDYSFHEDDPPWLHRCHYWNDSFRLARAKKWQAAIELKARPCPDLPSERVLLKESALMSSAASSCHNTLSERDCSVYHRAWQPMRLANLVSTPGWHGAFYSKTLRQWSADTAAEGHRPKILITGLADYGMLYWTLQSIDPAVRKRAEFHVLDLCESPLDSVRWLKQRLQVSDPPLEVNLICHHKDVFDNGLGAGEMDLILSDAFLTRFPAAEEKEALVKEWLRLRSAAGWIVTTARVRRGTSDRDGSSDIRPTHRQEFRTRVQSAALEMTPELGVFLSDYAPEYAGYINSYPFAGEADVTDFLHRNVPAEIPRNVGFRLIPHREMVEANYAYVQIGGNGRRFEAEGWSLGPTDEVEEAGDPSELADSLAGAERGQSPSRSDR